MTDRKADRKLGGAGDRQSPLLAVVVHEWRRISRDRTLWIAGALLTTLMLYAAFNGAAWIDFQEVAVARALAEEKERLASMRVELGLIDEGKAKPRMFRDPARPGWVGEFLGRRYATLPPSDLAALSIGQRDLYPSYFRISTLSADNFINEDEIENPLNLITGRFDVAFVIIYLLPLVILASSYDLMSSEKESGTLALVLSQPLGAARLALCKTTARFVPIICLAILLSVLSAALTGAHMHSGHTVLRLLLWSLAIALYASFWFAIAAWVNAFGKNSATNAVTLAAVWLGLTIIAPAFLTLAVTWIDPVDSRISFITAMRDERRDTAERTGEILANFYKANPELQPEHTDKNDYMPGFYAAQIERDKQFLPILRRYESQLAVQNELAEQLRVVSPPLAAQYALNELAATGFRRYSSFLDQVHAFHSEWQAFFLPKLFKRERLTESDYDLIPKFRFEDEPTQVTLRRVGLSLLAVLTPTLLVGGWTLLRLKRFPIAN